MDLSIRTSEVDVAVALQAHGHYKAGHYKEAIPLLQNILDLEPNNWQARLFLAASFFKTGLPMASQRAFRYVFQSCPDEGLRQKACLGFQFVNASICSEQTPLPAEFGVWAEKLAIPSPNIEHIIT